MYLENSNGLGPPTEKHYTERSTKYLQTITFTTLKVGSLELCSSNLRHSFTNWKAHSGLCSKTDELFITTDHIPLVNVPISRLRQISRPTRRSLHITLARYKHLGTDTENFLKDSTFPEGYWPQYEYECMKLCWPMRYKLLIRPKIYKVPSAPQRHSWFWV